MATKSLGQLTVDLVAKVGGFVDGMDKADRAAARAAKNSEASWQKMSAGAKKHFAAVAKAAVAVGAGLATSAAVMVKSSINAADAASKMAQGAGVSVESLTAMQYAADLAGVSNEKLGTSMGRLNRSISDAAKGLKTQSQAFADLGISVNDAQGNLRSADQVLLDVADKFSQYEDGAAKSAIAMELFGRAGAELIPMLNQGSDGIRGLMEEAEMLGLVIDTQTAQAAERFNDSLTTMGKVGAGVGNQLMTQMLPVMNGITGLMLDYAKNSDAATTASNLFGGALKGLISVGVAIGAAFDVVGTRIGAVAAALVMAAQGDFKAAWNTIKEANEDTADTVTEAVERINKLWSGEYAKTGAAAVANTNKVEEAKKQLTRTTGEMEAATKAAIKGEKDFIKEVERAAKELAKQREEAEKLRIERQKILGDAEYQMTVMARQLVAVQQGEQAQDALNRELFRENVLRSESYQKLLPAQRAEYLRLMMAQFDLTAAIADANDEQQRQADIAKAAAEETQRVWEEATNRIDAAFADAWKGAFDSFSDFASSLKDAFKNLLGNLAHMAISRPILVSLGLGGSGAAMASGGGGAGGLGNLLSLKNLTGLLDSTPLAGLGMALQDFSATSGFGGLFDVGTRLTDLSAMDLGLSALAGYAGNFLGGAMGEAIFGKEAESAWGATIGGVAGTLIGGPIGALFGSTIGGLLDVAFGGDGKKRSAIGVQTSPNWMGADTKYSPVQIEAESGLLLTAYAKRAGDEAGELAAQMTQMFAMTDAALTDLFTTLGVTVDLAGQSLAGINSEFGEDDPSRATFFGAAGFNGELSREDLAGAADEFVLAWADRVNELAGTAIDLAPLQAIQREGELLADVLLRANAQFAPVNAALDALGLAAYELSVQGMASADALVQMLGGLENFTAATSQYYQLFYSEEERLAQATEQLQGVFAGLNMAMPETNAQFRAIVEGLDLTTETGQATFATLMSIAPAFNQVTTAAEAAAIAAQELAAAQAEQALAARNNTLADIAGTILGNYGAREKNLASLEQQLGSIDDQIMSVQEQIADASSPVADTIRNITASVDTLAFSSSQLRSIADNLLGTAASLRLGNLSPLTHLDRLEEAQRQYDEANRAAQSGDASGLASAAQAYLQQAAAYYASSPAYVQIFEGVVGNLEAMGVQMDAQADAAERQERAQAAQQASLAAIQAASSNTSRLTELYGELDKLMQEKQLIEQQIANLTATTSQDILSSQLDRLISITDGIDSMAALLGSLPASIADGLASVIGMAIAEYRDLTPTEEFFDAVPAFASGGSYGGGLALVGEQGPELINFRTPGFVHNASDTRDMLSGDSGEVVGELKALRQEVAALRKTVAEGSKEQVGATKETTRATEDVGRKLKTPVGVLS